MPYAALASQPISIATQESEETTRTLLASEHQPALETAHAASQPNIVWLISEDNSHHFLQRFHSGGAKTPRIDALAEHGVTFQHAFSNAPVCSVARTTLMTGCFAPRIGTQFHRAAFKVPLPAELHMFPYYLREAGYYTTNQQKKDYNAVEGAGVWDESSRQASWRNRKPNQPFFHMQSFTTSHESSLHFSQQQFETQPTQTDPEAVELSPKHPDTELFRYTYARYHDRIQQVDQQIGDVVEMLSQDGLLDNTFIFYFGDHGGVLPGSKGYLYETGLHVPLVVRIPDRFREQCVLELGGSTDAFVSFIDFAPTVLRLAGVDPPSEMDGKAFLGEAVTAAQLEQRDHAVGYADRFDERSELVRSLRRGKWKYIRNYQAYVPDAMQNNYRYKMLAFAQWRSLYLEGSLDQIQQQFFRAKPVEMLFDLEADPYETKNLALDSSKQDVLQSMRQELRRVLKSWPDLSFIPEQVLATEAAENPTQFGKDQADRIGQLIDVADDALLPAAEHVEKVMSDLASSDPLIRLWAIRACTSRVLVDDDVQKAIKDRQQRDPHRLVRVAAAEYIALTQDQISEGLSRMRDELQSTDIPLEGASILNSMAILIARSSPQVSLSDLTIEASQLSPAIRSNDAVKRRLEYLRSLQ